MKKDINSLIVSTRVRLARNLERVPFKTEVVDAFDSVATTIKNANPHYLSVRIDQLHGKVANALYEQHLISRELLSNSKNGMIVVKDDKVEDVTRSNERVCVMLGEEDHIRIQVIKQGFDLQSCFNTAKKISDDISKEHKIAHRNDFGYLTTCPTNLGTGMRASVMMFLPALSLTNQISVVARQLKGEKITIRGVYGEGSKSAGYMYQISNQACLELDEGEILEKVNEIVRLIAVREIDLQKSLLDESPDQIINQVMRSLGILTHAHMISSDEAVEHLAWLKLGDCIGIVKFKPGALDDLFFVIQPATLTTQNEKASEYVTRDKMRAKKISEVLRVSRMK
ncbi:MAG: hypothetical protein FWE45_02430 [Firmicutes bacterium]|nr:hypothetical protein [Bacillota bacterium]